MKTGFFYVLALVGILVGGCEGSTPPDGDPVDVNAADQYLPLKVGNKWNYISSGNHSCRNRGRRHSTALRMVGDRISRVMFAMLQSQTLYRKSPRKSEEK